MNTEPRYDNRYLYAAIALTLMSSVLWTAFQVNSYNTYRFTSEVGYAAFPMYYYLHFPGLVHGLQYLVFQDHIAPDQWLLMPLFYLFPSSLTLMVAQAIITSLTGLLVFLIARDLTKNPLLALAFSLVYFINPGIVGILIFDYHVEVFILPFYLLTFYYYMKLDRKPFYLSLALLLCTFESVFSIVAALGLGLLAYEYLCDRGNASRGERMRLAIVIVAAAAASLLFYNLVYYGLQGSYSTLNSAVPPNMRLLEYPLIPLNFNMGSLARGSVVANALETDLLYAFSLVFLSFGIASLFDFVPTLIFALPWLAGLFLLQNYQFLYAWRNSYVMGGVIVGAILGSEYASNAARRVSAFLARLNTGIEEIPPTLLIAAMAIAIGLPFGILMSQGIFTNSAFQSASVSPLSYAQISSVEALIPPNASVMTQFNIFPRMFQRST